MAGSISLENLGFWRARIGAAEQLNAPGLHPAIDELYHWMHNQLVNVLAYSDTMRLEATPSCALARKGSCRKASHCTPAPRTQQGVAFCVFWPLWDDCAAVSKAQQDHGLDGFWRDGIARQVWVAAPQKDSKARRLAFDLALCSQALAPGSRRGKNSTRRVGFLHPKPSTKKQPRGISK